MSKAARATTPPLKEGLASCLDRHQIDDFLRESLEETRRVFGGNPRLVPLFERVNAFVLQGGKRIRPLLCVASHRIVDQALETPRAVWLTAASLEIFHAFMLIHDDIIDQSSMRRDRPTLHECFRIDAGLPSLSMAEKRGTDLALLSGDLLCALAMRLVARSGLSDEALGRAFRLLSDMLVETGLGEVLDVIYERDPLEMLGEAPLLETYLRKTARYTVSGPLVLGATVAGASPKTCQALDRFGDLLGFGFQIQNDLDSLAEDVETGDHADLDTGKRTYVLWKAYQRLSPRLRSEMTEILAQPASIERRRHLLRLIKGSGAIRLCKTRVAELQREAVAVLRESPLTLSQRRAYIQLVEQFRLKAKPRQGDFAKIPSVIPLATIAPELAYNPT